MTDDILDSIAFVIGIMIIGAVLIVLGIAFQSLLLVLVGGFFVGTVPILKIILSSLEGR